MSVKKFLFFQMVKEKNRFRKNPFNYASTKNTLLREKVVFF